MKKISFVFIICVSCFTDCKKDNDAVNVTLYNKPLPVIQSYIHGKWELLYGKGGFAANTVQYYQNTFWTFTPDNKIIRFNMYKDGTTDTDTTILWIHDLGSYTNGDSTFIMNFYDKYGYPNDFVVDQIFNDTLILHESASDAVFYHFTKSN
jgi:hypothetical protein